MAYITISPAKIDEEGGSSNNQIEDVYRGKGFVTGGSTFSATITAHPDVDEDGATILETVLWCGVEPASFPRSEEPDITTSNSVTVATISGRYLNRFEDHLQYLNPGKAWCNGYFTTPTNVPPALSGKVVTANTDLIEEPTSIVGFGNLPANTNLFSLVGDTRTYVTETFNVYVNVQPMGGTTQSNQAFTVVHDIYNDWEFYVIRVSEHKKTFVNYNANNYSFSNSLMQSTYAGYLY